MRGRTVVVGLLCGVVGLLGVVVAGCGSSSKSSSASSSASSSGSASGASGVTLSVLGSSGNLNTTACGKQEPFEHYTAPAQVRYTGMVSPAPSGRWKVKVKLKLCNGKAFVDAGSQKIVGQPTGRYDGLFPVDRVGYYSLRATLEGNGRPESPKIYLQAR
jgi:hypothetical protein